MSDVQTVYMLALLPVLVGYLIYKEQQRARDWEAEYEAKLEKWSTRRPTGDTELCQAVARVRGDYLAVRHLPPHLIYHQKALLALAREAIEKLGYFKAHDQR